jgi:hypothetical protein
MPSLDLCINDIFEPGNIPADPGVPPTVPVLPPSAWEGAAIFTGTGMLRVSTGGDLLGIGDGTFSDQGAFSFIGALVTNAGNVDLFTNNIEVAGTWNTETRDTNAFHDTGSNTNRITIPSAINGRLVIIHATAYVSHASAGGTSMLLYFKKNGSASFDGASAFIQTAGYNTQKMATLQTAPLIAATGDIYELFCHQDSGDTADLTPQSTFGIWVIH